MFLTIVLVLVVASLLASAAWILAKSASRLLGLLLFLITPPIIAFAFITVMGVAKPIYPPIFNVDEHFNRIVWTNPVEGEAIYVVVMSEEMTEPRLYALPWDNGMAERIQKSLTDGHVFMRLGQRDGNLKLESQVMPLPDPPKDEQ